MRAKARSGGKRKKRHQGGFLPGEARLECAALELEARAMVKWSDGVRRAAAKVVGRAERAGMREASTAAKIGNS